MSQQIPRTSPVFSPPNDFAGFKSWAIKTMDSIYRILARRLEAMILQGVEADQPTADGTQRLFFSTDTKVLRYDDGSFQGPHLEVIATASLPAAAAAQNGRIVIEDAAVGDRNIVIYAGAQRFRLDGGAAF